jgi:soluble lytic murein transglycosylase-like protein
MQKLLISFFVSVAVVFIIPIHCENILEEESSFYLTYSKAAEQAIVKSIFWASDDQIRKLVKVLERKYGSEIQEIAKKYFACPKDITAITIVESLTEEDAESPHGAVGLMGVKRTTGKDMGFDDIEHPVNNLKAGTKYYISLLEKFKDRDLAFAAYNLGPGEVENRLKEGFDPETIDYIWKIRRVRHLAM